MYRRGAVLSPTRKATALIKRTAKERALSDFPSLVVEILS